MKFLRFLGIDARREGEAKWSITLDGWAVLAIVLIVWLVVEG